MMRVFLPLLLAGALAPPLVADPQVILHAERSSPGDLEVSGDLTGLPTRTVRYIRYQDLLNLPQESYTVTDDSNFPAKTEIGGVALETLARLLGQPADTFVDAICDDQYRANYPHDYIAVHHPLLVLRINGKPHDQWPPLKDGGSLGPYLISHPFFKPAFKILSHEDEPQIPYGVIRIEFHRESVVFGAISPPGTWPANSPIEQGYEIARQDCFRCHNMGAEGGTKAGRSWQRLATCAAQNGPRFRQTIRNPRSVNPKATMPAHTGYDNATLAALTTYFKTFAIARRNP
jgi:hypothetical protein